MSELRTLQLLLEQAEHERDAALSAFQQAQARAAQAHAQTRDLSSYQQQYDRRWLEQFQSEGAAVQILQAQQQFGLRLSEAIDQQSGNAALLDARVATTRQQLQEREMRVASVRKLIERRQAEMLLKQMRSEQKLSDEFAARRQRPNSP